MVVAEHRLHAGAQVGGRQRDDADLLRRQPELQDRGRSAAQTKPQDAARVFIPNGDQIIGKGLERILIGQEEVQRVFDDVAATLTEEAQPVIEQVQSLEG